MNIAEKCDTIENENPNNRRNSLVANNVNVKNWKLTCGSRQICCVQALNSPRTNTVCRYWD